ncbi:MAG: TetR/AcrR family transcriptional regulator [Bacteroidales bacterium]|nr:TetR/AcrR family transcriptional regulator [Bacteroidales bacterium]
MSPRTEQQFSEIREQRKATIMQAGLELFAQYSIETTSISMIAKRAGISKGLIYNYFDNKEALIVAIVTEGFEEFTRMIPETHGQPLSKEQLIHYLNTTFEVLTTDFQYWKLYFSIVMQPSVMKLIENQLMVIMMPVVMLMADYYESQGVANPMAYARMLGAILDGISLNYMLDPENFPLTDIKNILIQKFI